MTDPADEPAPPLPRNVKVLSAASLVNDIASEAIYPVLPHYLLTSLQGSWQFLGLIEGLADATASLLKLASGAWSDRLGQRKGFILLGYFLSAIARPLLGLATLPAHVLGCRIFDRFGKGIRTAPRDALLADSTPATQRGRAFGFHRSMDHVGAIIGAGSSGLFLYYYPNQFRLLCLLTIIPGLAVVVLMLLGLQETARTTSATATEVAPPPAPFGREFRWYLVAILIFTLGNSSDGFLLAQAGAVGVPTALIPVIWGMFHVIKSAGNLWSGAVVDRIGPRPLLIAGWCIYGAVYFAFEYAETAWTFGLVFMLYGLFYSLTEPAEKKLVTLLVPADQHGRAFGWFHAMIGLASLPSSLLFGYLYEHHGPAAAFTTGAGLAILAAVLLHLMPVARPSTIP